MASKVLYPPSPATPTHPLRGGRSNVVTANGVTLATPNEPTRPRRKAALASEAATLAVSASSRRKSQPSKSSNSSSSTLPNTPLHQLQQARQEEKAAANGTASTNGTKKKSAMAALPRAKRARRSDPETDVLRPGYAANGSGLAATMSRPSAGSNSRTIAPIPAQSSKHSIMLGMDSALNGHMSRAQDLSQTGASQSGLSSSGSGIGSSIREMIAGREREVFVVDSASPAPSASGYGTGQGAAYTKGKRKAAGSPSAYDATSGQRYAKVPAPAPAASTAAASKRRRKDDPAPADPGLYSKPDMVRNLYTGNGNDAALGSYSALAPKPATQSGPQSIAQYRGGYNAGNTYYKQPANGAVPTPAASKLPTDDSEGHFIVREGEFVSEQYRITSLLGQGTFGKVVKCNDILNPPRQVAIKIIRAVQKYTDAAQIEIRVLRTLRENDPWNENKCIHLLDTFTYRNHVCIVSELLGQSVFDFLKDNNFHPFPPRHIWVFANQLLRSVAFLHRLGLIHTDLKPENILLVESDYDLAPITWRANSRKKRVLQRTDIRLIDFGSATFNDEYHSQVVSTRHYRAPEIILQMGWSFPCDAWSIGCILIEFYTGEALFQTHDNLEHVAMMEAVLGPMGDDFRRKAETYRPNYFRAGRLDFPNSTTNRQSRKYVKAMKPLDEMISSPQAYAKHDRCFKSLLKGLMTFDPSRRMTVNEAMDHPYFHLTAQEIPP